MRHEDDDEEGSHRKKKKSFGLGGWRMLLLCLAIGLVLGAVLGHTYLEPLINDNAKKLSECSSTNSLLNSENESCYRQLADVNSKLPCKKC